MAERKMIGRKILRYPHKEGAEINPIEIIEVLEPDILKNRREMKTLYNYYKGDQPILNRVKDIRPEINNKVVENRAYQIVSFHSGYLVNEPLQYVAGTKKTSDEITNAINDLNTFMKLANKSSGDLSLVEQFYICGTAYRLVLPDTEAVGDPDRAPFKIATLDAWDAFVVYDNSHFQKPIMAGTISEVDGKYKYCVYSKNYYYEINDKKLVAVDENPLGAIPIVEYIGNNARLGLFEVVLPMLNAINTVNSNRIDGVEQFIQALMVFKNTNIESDEIIKLRKEGAIAIYSPSQNPADVEYLVQELNQQGTQILLDSLILAILEICDMPNRNGGSSTSDTGKAVEYRDGWNSAENLAKKVETIFKKSEQETLRLVLKILRTTVATADTPLTLKDIDVRFTRRNYGDLVSKANVLNLMLSNDKIAPELAFSHSGMFVDSERAYSVSKAFIDKYFKEKDDNDTGTNKTITTDTESIKE